MKKSSATKALLILLALLLLIPIVPASAAPLPDTAELQNAPNVTAQAAIVIDQATGEILWGRNIDQMRPPASMTKVMTAYIVYEEIAAGRLTHDTLITISQAASNLSRNDTRFLAAGSQHSVETLLRLMMLPSNNGACVAMADHISGSESAFVARMNETARRLGMDASYENAHGQWANLKSARAVAILVRDFITRFPDILRITNMNTFYFNGVRTQNTNWRLITQPWIDGFKTGTTPAAGFCLSTTATRYGRRVVAVTMASSSFYTRVSDNQNLLNFGLNELLRREESLENITVNLTTNVDTVRRHANFNVTAHFNNITGNASVQGGEWRVNGQRVHTVGSFVPASQRTVSLTHWIPAHSWDEYLEIDFILNLTGDIHREAFITIPVSTEPPARFRDIHRHWAYTDINQAVTRELFSGTGGGLFDPNGNMTRAMFVTVLGRAARQMGIPIYSHSYAPFTDVSWNTWYTDYVSWAWEQGFIQGIGGDLFGTNRVITRQEVATLFYRFMEHYGLHLPGTTFTRFPDEDQIANWAYDAIREAVRIGLITGFADGRLAPSYTASRAQLATIFLRFLNSAGESMHTQNIPDLDEYESPSYDEEIEEYYFTPEDQADDLT